MHSTPQAWKYDFKSFKWQSMKNMISRGFTWYIMFDDMKSFKLQVDKLNMWFLANYKDS